MKKFKPRSKASIGISITIVTLIIAILAQWFQIATRDAIVNTTLAMVEEIGQQQEFILESAIAEGAEDLATLSEYLVRDEVGEEVIDFFHTQSQATEFDTLFYIDLDGNGISKDGTIYDFSATEAYVQALSNPYFVTKPYISTTEDQILMGIFLPVTEQGVLLGVLYGEITLGDFFSAYRTETDGKGDVFVVDYDMNFAFSSSEGHVGAISIPEQDIAQMGVDNVLEAQQNIINGKNGSFYYQYDGVEKVMTYMPIEMTRWALAINVESSVINADIKRAVELLNYICTAIYWFLIALIAYTSFYHVRSKKLLQKTAYYDELTGLPNLKKFQLEVAEVIEAHPKDKFTMQKMDLARFSMINELYGVEMGNHVLLKIAQVMQAVPQQVEKTFICSRVGADEFIMFAGNEYLDHENSARRDSEGVFKALVPELQDYEFIFRYGRYFIQPGETDVMDMINKVTLAHSRARSHPHQRTWDYDDAYRQEILRNTELNNKRKAALANTDFKVFLQPKFSVAEERLVGAEALVRWIEPDGTMNFPDEFIPLFERNGFISELDRYVLEHVCMAVKRWMEMGLEQLTVSVNCSRLNVDNPNFVSEVVSLVDRYGIPHGCIELELTESITVQNEKGIEKLFVDLRRYGLKSSIDDFGAGYSSLGMLKNLKVDTLKMDRSFFMGNNRATQDKVLVDSIVKLAHNLGIYVVAEGIETMEQMQLLQSVDCDAVQGYYYARPMSIAEFEERYGEQMRKNSN